MNSLYFQYFFLYSILGIVYRFSDHLRLAPYIKKLFFLSFNIFFTYIIFFKLSNISIFWFIIYIILISFFYVSLRYFSFASKHIFGMAFFLPIVWMILTKISHWMIFIGVSYMAFRLSYLAYEVKIKRISIPHFVDYLSFSFFTPTFLMGPINPYSYFKKSMTHPDRTHLMDGCVRIAVGALKCFILANLANQLGFKNLWFDGSCHTLSDFFLCSIMSYLYIYLNFSGYTDISIGLSSTMRIHVKENFNYPLTAPNMIELWRRWHISLAEYLRDVFFMPFLLFLSRKLPNNKIIHLTAFALFITFIINGLWHGLSKNFIIVGLMNGIGITICHYYNNFITHLSFQQKNILNKNSIIRYFGIFITLIYFSIVCFFFITSAEESSKILHDLLPTLHYPNQ